MAIEKCVKCGKEHDNEYEPMSLLNGEKLCLDCINETTKNSKYWFRGHIPGCCEGFPHKYFATNDKEEFLKILQGRCSRGFVIATDKEDHHYLMEVNENEHWVAGFVNIDLKEEFDLPFYEDIRKEENNV